MLDDIGLGKAIADIVYLSLIIIGIYGILIFKKKKSIFGMIFWASFISNIIFYLYFMGKYSLYSKALYPTVVIYWPLTNFVLFILLLIFFFKSKCTRKK